jgi:hypothetical protein
MTMRTMRFVASVVLGAWMTGAAAQTAPPDLSLEVVTDAVPAPVGVRAPHDGSGRLFVFSQAGTIRIIDAGGTLLPTPFLTLSVTFPGPGGTSGLLGLAFHPNYGLKGLPHNDELYVVYMRSGNCSAPGSCLGSGPDEVLERYTVSSDPNVANPAGTVVMRIADNSPPSYHNGGDIHFGPDGYFYMSVGDGGQESGTHWLAECLWKKPNDTTSASCDNSTAEPQYFLRGKMLRIDVDNRTRRCAAPRPASRPSIRSLPTIRTSAPRTPATRRISTASAIRGAGASTVRPAIYGSATSVRITGKRSTFARPDRPIRSTTAGTAWKARRSSTRRRSARRRCRRTCCR